MKLNPTDIDRGLEELLRIVRANAAIEPELADSRKEFFVHGPPIEIGGVSDDEARRAARRHLEWFLLERPNAELAGVPVEWALHRFADLDTDELTEDQLRALLSSRCSVFEVTSVSAGEGVWVRDLAAMGEYPLSEPEGSQALETGDLIVGRLFAIGESLYRVSPAAGVFRSSELLSALVRDLEQLRKGRRGVLRLSQAELEAMFWQRVGLGPVDDPVARARAFLLQSGLSASTADAMLEELACAPFDDARIVVGGRDVLGAALDRLAFETEVDLELARRVLIEAWSKLALGRTSEREASERRRAADVREAIAAFDRGRSEGRDLDKLFDQLERDLELEPEPIDPDAIDGAPAPDFPGVVGAMVDEFLWETEREKGSEAARQASVIRAFAEFGADYGVFENMRERELVLFAAVWLPERRLLRTPEDARRMMQALREFCAWSQETQSVPLLEAFESHLPPIEESLPRLVEANRWCRTDASGSKSDIYEFVSAGEDGVSVRDRFDAVHAIDLDPRIARALVPGDRLRAHRAADGSFEVFSCYPAQSALVAP